MKTLSVKASRKKLGENIRRVRKTEGISQKQLGFESGLSRELISQIESGKSNVTHDTLYSIASSLNVSLKQLFDFDQ